MEKSIIPKGFECTAHPIFKCFEPPEFLKPSQSEPQVNTRKAFKAVMNGLDEESINCSICLSTFDNVVTVCGCLHSFCRHCLERWLLVTENCPMCKSEILVYISAEPGSPDQQLFSRNSITDTAIRSQDTIVGMDEAVKIQAALHSMLSRRNKYKEKPDCHTEVENTCPKRQKN